MYGLVGLFKHGDFPAVGDDTRAEGAIGMSASHQRADVGVSGGHFWPMPGNFAFTLARTAAFSALVPCCDTRANALRA